MPDPLEMYKGGEKGMHEIGSVEGSDAQRMQTQGGMQRQKHGTKGAELDPAAAGRKAGEMKGRMEQVK